MEKEYKFFMIMMLQSLFTHLRSDLKESPKFAGMSFALTSNAPAPACQSGDFSAFSIALHLLII